MKLLAALLSLFLTLPLMANTSSVWFAGQGGVYHAEFDSARGSLSEAKLAAEFGSGSWLEFHPSEPIIYSSWRTKGASGIMALKILGPGETEEFDQIELSTGAPSHLRLNPDATFVATAHYGSEATALVSLRPDGSFGELKQIFRHEGSGPHRNQSQSRPHWAGFDSSGRMLHVTDLGSDEIWTFLVDANAESPLTLAHKTPLPPGSGPRHLSFGADEKFAYVSDELSHHISVFAYDRASGRFTTLQHIDAAPAELDELTNNVSEIRVHPSGRFVYTGNRGHDSIAVFTIDDQTGKIAVVEREPVRGVWPRNFNFSPDGKWLLVAGQYSGTVAVFAIDPETGALRYNRQIINVPSPVRVLTQSD